MQPHIALDPEFSPRNGSPTIKVMIRKETKEPLIVDDDTYEMSDTSVEYDVVKCEDFVSDPGRWVRYMPEEIRLANPDFVPT